MALQNILIPFVSIFRSAGLKQAQSALGGLNKQYDNLGKTIGAAVGAMQVSVRYKPPSSLLLSP